MHLSLLHDTHSPYQWESLTLHCAQALIHGLNRHYYSIGINYRKNDLEEKMLLNLHKKKWADGLTVEKFDKHMADNEAVVMVSAD